MDPTPRTSEAAPLPPAPRAPEAVLAQLLSRQKTLKLATSGGPVSPWITGTYFTEDGPFRLYLTLEKRGKGMANVAANPRVAVAIDGGSPFESFAQGEAEAHVVTGPAAEARLAQLKGKVPEIAPLLAGELNLMELRVSRWLLTSFPDGMFPARALRP
jgi:nitroimidazol reductase NimA-like FMN-containing flavoprotein (pyridoxamine 5'-phosphate oxidase superfamily)